MAHPSTAAKFVAKIMADWDISAPEMAELLGLSKAERSHLPFAQLPFEQSARLPLLVRLAQSLNAYFDGDLQTITNWLRTENLDLRLSPMAAMQTEAGLRAVCDYVDAFRFR